MTIRNRHGGFNEIGRIDTTDSSIVDWQKQKLATRGQIKHVQIDPRFRGMGLATKMYGEAMKQAPRGRLVSDSAQFDGGNAIWNRLQRNKGYEIRENPKIDEAGDGFVSRDNRPLFIGRITPRALSAKLRLRELAAGELVKNSMFVPAFVKARAYRASAREQQKIQRVAMQKIRRGIKISDKYGEMGDQAVSSPFPDVPDPAKNLRRQEQFYNKSDKIQKQVYKKYGYSGEVAGGQKKFDLGQEKYWNRRAKEQKPYLIAGGIAGGALALGGASYLATRKENSLSAKLRLRELARGDYAIPTLGKMLKDRSMLEEFLTGKRGPKLGDLAVGRFQMNKRALRTKNGRTTLSGYPKSRLDVSVSKVVKTPAGKEIPGDMERIRQQWVSDSYSSGPETLQVTNQMLHQARQRARDKVAKIIRKGRAGGDVYEELSAKLRLRELARGDYAIPALGKMLRDRSLLEEFLTGNRGPKLGDLRAGKLRGWHNNIRLISQKPIFASNSRIGNFTESVNDAARNSTLRAREGDDFLQKETQARTAARNQLAKIIRKGRSGGDVYDEIDRGKFSGRLVGDHEQFVRQPERIAKKTAKERQ
jgi:hypothetical protein